MFLINYLYISDINFVPEPVICLLLEKVKPVTVC